MAKVITKKKKVIIPEEVKAPKPVKFEQEVGDKYGEPQKTRFNQSEDK